jgi:hypothetical protein
MKLQFLCVLVLAVTAQARASTDFWQIYDQEIQYTNPLPQMLSPDCHACVHFQSAHRPLFPLVTHEFIGVQVSVTCPAETKQGLLIYGASKGLPDFQAYQKFAAANPDSGLWITEIGQACDQNAMQALDAAATVSREWQDFLSNEISFGARLVATPLLGQPCTRAAHDVAQAIKPFLQNETPSRHPGID